MKKLIRQSVSIISYTLILSLLFSVLLFSSCSKSKDNGEDDNGGNVAVTKVSLNKTTLSLAVGGTETLTATVLPEKATNKTVTWESSNTKVATVSNGTVTAVSEGSATITVKSADGKKSAKCEVTVKASSSITEIKLNKTTLSLEVGAKETLTANTKVTWSSSAPLIATVTTEGVVTGIAVGKATITATTEDGKLTAKCEVEVMANSVPELELNKTTLSLEVGAKDTLTANTKVTWSSSAPLIASVTTEGVVTGIAVGKATITATSEDGKLTAKCEVEVKAAAVTEIKLNKTTLSLEVGAKETLTANVKVKWSSSAPLIASVTADGVVTAVAVGKATITATSEDGKLTAKCEVEVKAAAVTEIKLNKTTLSLEVGAKETLTANVKVKWSSSAPLIASVTADGVVTGVAVGKATITATSEGGKLTAKCEVEVKAVPVTGIKLSASETVTLAVGGTQTINCTVSPDNAGNKNVKWTTSDNTKVEITSQSNTSVTIKALAEGSATITATTEDGNHTAKCTVKVVAPADFEGEGTEADPYRISTRKDLETLATKVNGGERYEGKYFKLMNNIDLGGSASPWTPIGNGTYGFRGIFDGNSKTISGLYINQPTLDYQALFSNCVKRSGSTMIMIKNLSVTGSVTGGEYCGGIVGYAEEISITGCTSDVTVIGKTRVGGILGYNFSSTTITDCVNKGNVTGDSFVGGVVGLSSFGSPEISGCSNSGNVTAKDYGGGIAGKLDGRSRLFNCSNRGTISGSYYLGGIVGKSSQYIATCVNAGLISGERYIGGIVGESSDFIVGCYSTGEVNGKEQVGGISGRYDGGQIVACYSTAKVDGTNMAGGLVGWCSRGTVNMSYCLNAADGGTDVAVGKCGTGVTVGTDVAALSKADMTNGTMLKDLNTAVDSYNSTKPAEAPTAKKFTKGTDGWPVF